MNFLNRLVERRVEKRIAVIFKQRTPEEEAMYQEQLRIRDELGFERENDTQAWLRLHQILLSHEERLKHLECNDGRNTSNKG